MTASLLDPVPVINDHECRISASIDISTYPSDGEDSVTLIKHADMARYMAKSTGKNRYCFYRRDMEENSG